MSFASRQRRVVGQDFGAQVQTQAVPATKVSGGTRVDRITLTNRAKPRSAELVAAVAKLDTTVDAAARQAIMNWIRDEYDARQGGTLIGLFAKCYLGPPFVDHKLSLLQTILEHYAPEDDPGHPYNQARGLVRSGAYAHIEVYSDGAIVPIRPDGTSVDFSPA